jgi:hypothetical protein
MNWNAISLFGALLIVIASGQFFNRADSAIAGEPERANLQLRLKKGDVFVMKLSIDEKTTQAIPLPMRGQISNDLAPHFRVVETAKEFVLAYEVQKVDNKNNISLKATIQNIYYKITKGDKNEIAEISYRTRETKEYDSTNPPEITPPFLDGIGTIIGKSFTMVISSTGKVQKVEGMDAIFNSIRKSIIEKNNIPETQLEKYSYKFDSVKNLKLLCGEDAMKSVAENMLAVYRDASEKYQSNAGRKMVVSDNISLVTSEPIATIVNRNWAEISRQDGIISLEGHSTITSDPNAALKMKEIVIGHGDGVGAFGRAGVTWSLQLKESYSLSGPQFGAVELLENSGWPSRGQLSQHVTGQCSYKYNKSSTLIPEDVTQAVTSAGSEQTEEGPVTFVRMIAFERLAPALEKGAKK